MKETNEDKYVMIIILIVSVILCFGFVLYHTVPDTYCILGEENYSDVFLQNGRIFNSLYVKIGKLLNIPIFILDVVSNVVAIICQSLCVYIIYKEVAKKEDKLIKKIIYLVGAYLVIYNPLAIEHLAYLECGIMCFGKLACVLAAKMVVKEEKLFAPMILIILASLCYQGVLNVFITAGLLMLVLEEDKQVKPKIKKLLEMVILCAVALATMVLALYIGNKILGTIQNRIRIYNTSIMEYIRVIIEMTFKSLNNSYNLYSQWSILICIIVTIILMLMYKKPTYALVYLGLITLIILSCTVPLVLQRAISVSARMVSSIGSILGISIILLGTVTSTKMQDIIVVVLMIFIFGYNSFIYIQNGVMLQKSNKLERQYFGSIVSAIEEYEEENHVGIQNIAFYTDGNPNYTFKDFLDNAFTIKVLHTSFARLDSLNYYLKHNLQEVEENESYKNFFMNQDWTEFDKEQMIFEGDTLHLCVY